MQSPTPVAALLKLLNTSVCATALQLASKTPMATRVDPNLSNRVSIFSSDISRDTPSAGIIGLGKKDVNRESFTSLRRIPKARPYMIAIIPVNSLIGIAIVNAFVDSYWLLWRRGNRRFLRLPLGLQGSDEFHSKTVTATVADDGHHSQATRNPELNLQQITRFQPDSGIQFHPAFT